MPQFDAQRIDLANAVRIDLALENQLSASQARAYVRCLQTSWQVPTIRWGDRDSTALLDDARRLIHAADIFREIDGVSSSRTIECYRRAGEMLEWLTRAADQIRSIAPIELFAAAAFQLGGLPAMANALLGQVAFEEAGSRFFASFLRADFDRVIEQSVDFWRLHPELTNAGASARLLEADTPDRISWYFTVELIRALGLIADTLRRGDGERLARGLAKLKALDGMAARTFSEDVSLLIELLRAVAESYDDASLYRQVRRFAALNVARTPRLLAYARGQFSRGHGILWSSQRAGLDRLLQHESFALCTPTGSGKTLVANLALVKELLLRDHGDVVPLALYLVPSRALAGEVEGKLHAELGPDFIVTGLYGGSDWGITDYWLAAEKPTVLIATVEKADALMRYLAPLLLARVRVLIIDEAHQVVPDNRQDAKDDFADHSSRSIRLETFVARLLVQTPNLTRIALTAVAGGASGPVARWVESRPEAQPIGVRYRSTRQVIGVLETASARRSTMLLEIMNGKPLYVRDSDEPVYLHLQIPAMPQLPPKMRGSLFRFNEVTVLWTALHLVEGGRRILISLAQEPEQTMHWFKESFDLPEWEGLLPFEVPEGWRSERFAEARATCVDYCGEDSFEVALLDRGIATSHGQMPQRLRRLMTGLIEDKVCPITVATATLTEGVNLPFDIIFVTSLKRSSFDRRTKKPKIIPMSTAEFRNLAGRAGRPGATRGMEGITLVAVPTAIATTANGQKATQRRQMTTMRDDYEILREGLRLDELAEDGVASPLALLLEAIRERVHLLYGIATEEQFLAWLEAALPNEISDEAGTGAEDPSSRLADSVDELDAILLTALEELQHLDDGADDDPVAVEAKLVALWQRTFTFAAAAQESWLEAAFIRRGRAIVETVYPDAEERQRLYHYGFAPHVGRRFEAISAAIRLLLAETADYGTAAWDDRLSVFRAIGALLAADRGFGFRVRDTQTDKAMLENWLDILAWWMQSPEAVPPEPKALRGYQRFVADNLEFRLGVAIGAVVARAWSEGANDPLAVPSLAEWRETTGLPWFGFWARELLRWGTLDPFVAFVMAQGRAGTRESAAAMRPDFDAWLEDELEEITPDDRIDPQLFLRWERALPHRPRDLFDELPEIARLTGTTGAKGKYHVLPIMDGERVRWIDAAGYELAQSDDEIGFYGAGDLRDDFILDAAGAEITVGRVYRAPRRR